MPSMANVNGVVFELIIYIDSLAQGRASAMETPQFCAKPSIQCLLICKSNKIAT